MNIRRVASAVVLLLGADLAFAEDSKAQMPYNYIGMPVKEVASHTGVQPNHANNITFDSEGRHVFLEASGGTVDYADVEFSQSAPCTPKQELDSATALQTLGMNPADLELAIKKPDNHTYYDHKRGLKVSVACNYEGAPLTVGFSRKQYNVLMGNR